MGYSGAWRKLIHEKNLKSKISWRTPLNFVLKDSCFFFAWTDFDKVFQPSTALPVKESFGLNTNYL
jgi:hypothetical protein